MQLIGDQTIILASQTVCNHVAASAALPLVSALAPLDVRIGRPN